MRCWIYSLSLIITLSLPLILSGCTKRPYLISNLFEQVGVTADTEHQCVAIISEEKIDYFLCEPANNKYRIRIIPYDDEKAVLTVFPDINATNGGFLDVFEKEVRQVSIDVAYSLSDKNVIALLKNGKHLYLIVKSVPMEKFQFDALFLVDKYLIHQDSVRKRLR